MARTQLQVLIATAVGLLVVQHLVLRGESPHGLSDVASSDGASGALSAAAGSGLVHESTLARELRINREGHVGRVGPPTSAARKKQVVVGSSFGAHDDVYYSAVDTLGRLLPHDNVRVYGPDPRYDLHKDVLPPLGVSPNGKSGDVVDLLTGVASGWGEGPDGGADLVILGTCEIDMANYSDELFKLWTARPDDRKFDLVCIFHNPLDWSWFINYSADWARVGALRMMPISAHTAKYAKDKLLQTADEPDRYHLGYELVPIKEHLPLYAIDQLDLNSDGPVAHDGKVSVDGVKLNEYGRKDGRILRDAVIQGNFDVSRRDYDGILRDLEAELELDAEFWGYRFVDDVYVPISPDAFILHLAGGSGDPQDLIPPALARVVKLHLGLSYLEFFAFLGRVDLVVPAFAEAGHYHTLQASSTVAMAAQCGVPLLTTPRIRSAYSYLTDEVTIVRPQMLREISAIKALRGGQFYPPASPYSHRHERSPPKANGASEVNIALKPQTEAMIARGWVRDEASWKRFQRQVRLQNEETLSAFLWG